MAKHLTPIVGLAVVVALALAAVFGSMSLANPAMAAIGQPADVELTERVDSPQLDGSLTIDTGETEYFDITSEIDGGRDAFTSLTATPDDPAVVTAATPAFQASSTVVELGLVGVAEGTARVSVVVDREAPLEDETLTFEVIVNPEPESTPATSMGRMPNVTADIGPEEDTTATPPIPADAPGQIVKVESASFFKDGMGPDGEIDNYTVTFVGTVTTAAINDEPAADDAGWGTDAVTVTDGVFYVRDSGTATAASSVRIQVAANDGIDRTGADPPAQATQRFYVDFVAIVMPPMAVTGLEVTGSGDGYVDLEWDDPVEADADRITKYQGREMPEGGSFTDWGDIAPATGNDAADVRSARISGLTNDVEYTFQVRAVVGSKPGPVMEADVMDVVGTPTMPLAPVAPSFTQSSNDPGDSANYTIKFQIMDADDESDLSINTRQNDLVIEFHEDYGVPSSIRNTSVAITTERGMYPTRGSGYTSTRTFTPEDVTVDGEKVLISLGDMDEQDDRFDYDVEEGEVVTVHFRQSAGITTATEDGEYFLVEVAFGSFSVAFDEDKETPKGFKEIVYRKISLSEEDGGLGDVITATGKGYKNGTTLTVFVDTLSDDDDDPATPLVAGQDGRLNLGEDVLCRANVGSDDVGKCEFTVSHPVFSGGMNYVNAVDGRDQYARKSDTFELTASIQARPPSGSPGESIVIQIVDFPPNQGISDIQISRDSRHINCVGNCSTDQNGAASFSIIIPNWVKGGTQDLRVTVNDADDKPVRAGTTIDLAGPRVVSTPQTVVANQRISLVGTGFSPNAELGDDTPESRAISKVSIGGYEIPWPKVNDGRNVSVDDSGNWSASVDLPLVEATTGTGERLLRATDSLGRTGAVILNLTERDFDVTPPSGRVGTLAVVRGVGYPGKNDEGDSFTIDVTYKVQEGTETRVSVVPDASGRFEVQLRIPTTAPIPSTNQVEVTFEHEVGGTKVTDVKQHSIPEGLISTSVSSGGPGTTVTLNGEGFKTYAPIQGVKIGAIDITPAPRPHTDANGMMEFDILIPGLDVGIQTIEVRVGGTTSSVGFTVTESGINPGDIKPVAEAVEPLGDALDVIWHFNNDTKEWTFYDGMEGGTLTHTITGETYLILVRSNIEAILNRDTRSLTCVGDNCWNQIVW